MNKLIFLIFTAFLLPSLAFSISLPGEIADKNLQVPWLDIPDEREPVKAFSTPLLTKVSPADLPQLIDGDIDLLKLAIKRQIKRCKKQDPEKKWTIGKKKIPRKMWCVKTGKALLALAQDSDSMEALWKRAKYRFHWYKTRGREALSETSTNGFENLKETVDEKFYFQTQSFRKGHGRILFTGYYLPRLYGKRNMTDTYYYPLYKKPSDLVRVKLDGRYRWRKLNPDGSYSMYPDRYDIDWEGAISGKNLEIVYVDNIIDAFFLHIQGSGAVMIQNDNDQTANRILVNYAAQNGRYYSSIGRILKKEGVDHEYYSSLQGLKRYFRERPGEIDRIFPMNRSYIFFSESNNGPYGGNQTLLVDGHNIATDYRIYPYGAIALISTRRPEVENGKITGWSDFSRIMINQDTGGAITGPGRVDIYWGEGEYAELAAGAQNHRGEMYFAVIPD